jgi:NO-binding membrane sensor protein with MHYT domain
MSTALQVATLVVAVACLPTITLFTVWGLAGGDGEPENPVVAILALIVGIGSLYVVGTAAAAFGGLPEWRWALMWVPAVAGLLGVALSSQRTVGALAAELLLGLPALLLLLAGEVGA